MITRVIHNRFELDLSNVKTTHVEENNWLNDQIRSKYTYPIEINLTPEQLVAFNHINELNLRDPGTLIDVEFYTMGERHEAVLEIMSMVGNRANIEIRYGLEEFPNFSKPLSQLPLEKFDLEESIFDYAETIINQTYPDVNFNFPQVITDLFDTDSDQWQFFEGIVNKYVDGDFVINEYDAINDLQQNRNIIQPLPYLLHILKKGFEDAGYVLEGDILEDEYFKKTTIYALSEFYYAFNESQFNVTLNCDESISIDYDNFRAYYLKTISFPEPGRYKIAGNVYLRAFMDLNFAVAQFVYLGFQLWGANIVVPFNPDENYHETLATVDFNVNYTGVEGDLVFQSFNLWFAIETGALDFEAPIMDITVTQLAKFDSEGNPIASLISPDVIDLSKCVPEMNFGPFVNAFAKWRNYGIDIVGNTVNMSKLKTIVTTSNEALNMQPFEVKYPKREFNQGKSFTMSFFDVDSEEYEFKKLLIKKDIYQLAPFSKPDDATEILIDALPLPLKQKDGAITAHGFLDDNTKPQVVLYEGLTGGLNISESAEELSILNSYLNHHKEWFDFLINSISFNWSFTTYFENILRLKIKSIIYAYGQYHIIRRLSRKTKNDNVVDIEIETESL